MKTYSVIHKMMHCNFKTRESIFATHADAQGLMNLTAPDFPCAGVREFFIMTSNCLIQACHCLSESTVQGTRLVACEHQADKRLECPSGQYINIFKAYYGRLDGST